MNTFLNLDPILIILVTVFVTMGSLAFLYRLYTWWWGGLSRLWRRQVVIHTTERTPLQILISACGRLIIMIIIVLGVLIYEYGETIRRGTITLLHWMIGVLEWMISVLE